MGQGWKQILLTTWIRIQSTSVPTSRYVSGGEKSDLKDGNGHLAHATTAKGLTSRPVCISTGRNTFLNGHTKLGAALPSRGAFKSVNIDERGFPTWNAFFCSLKSNREFRVKVNNQRWRLFWRLEKRKNSTVCMRVRENLNVMARLVFRDRLSTFPRHDFL